ncbi:MAG: hypothetical protein ACXADF_02035 [Candidatus Thorarchaeota archaeon]|jgi:hypothetical protein
MSSYMQKKGDMSAQNKQGLAIRPQLLMLRGYEGPANDKGRPNGFVATDFVMVLM